MPLLTKTLQDAGFDDVFSEVPHSEALGLSRDNRLHLYRLNVENNEFSLSALQGFLLKNIGRYVFSRVKIDQFYEDKTAETIAAQAIGLLKKAGRFDENKIGEELGDIMLYAFLERVLNAPKLYNKIELAVSGGQPALNGGGVHLLSFEDVGGATVHQMVFGKSNVINDMQDAIDNAFAALETIRDNTAEEYRILDHTVLAQSFDKDTANYLRSIVVPSKRTSGVAAEKAFGVFIGYKLGLNPDGLTDAAFLARLAVKMEEDIKAHTAYIRSKITAARMTNHSFYFYILPFNDADIEKGSVMKTLLNGGIE